MKILLIVIAICSSSISAFCQVQSTLSTAKKSENIQEESAPPIAEEKKTSNEEIILERKKKKEELLKQQNAEPPQKVASTELAKDELGRTIITKEKFDLLPENRQKWVLERPNEYVIK